MNEQWAELASEAFVVAFPLVTDLEQVQRFTVSGVGAVPAAPVNTFGHARALAGPGDTFVSINNDTLYSIAQVDVGAGPVLLTVPDTGDRYHVLQFVDAWTNNFAYVGTRSTGNAAGQFLLVPPGWNGDLPTGLSAIRLPTRMATIVGRWAVDGEDDLAVVHALQDGLRLKALHGSDEPAAGVPPVAQTAGEALDFFERFRVWSQAFPPADRDRAAIDSYEPLGLTGQTPVSDLPDEIRQALETGYATGREALENSLRTAVPAGEGWQADLHLFDYNLDFFEIGALADAEWTLGEAKTRYARRAGAALGGLWGNHAYEAAYFTTYADGDGETLTGEHVYRLRLPQTPPVGAFWSLTMYSVPQYFLVANPAGRYSVGNRTRGIVYDDDGGLTITMSTTRPTDEKAAANWLPTPAGEFRPMMRMYLPADDVLTGLYRLPAIERIG